MASRQQLLAYKNLLIVSVVVTVVTFSQPFAMSRPIPTFVRPSEFTFYSHSVCQKSGGLFFETTWAFAAFPTKSVKTGV